MSYSVIAPLYDRINGDQYAPYAAFLKEVFSRISRIPVKEVLDLGCGTGSIAALLADDYDMVALDVSPDMLSIAMEKNAGKNTLLLCQDMRNFELYGTVGAVVSTLDCVNYLVEDGDLDQCFALVHNYLDPDGLFLFDVNNPHKFDTVYGDNAYVLEDDTSLCAWQNDYDRESGLCGFYLSIFTEGRDGKYTRLDEEHTERCYTKAQLTDALTRAGFADIAFFKNYQFDAPDAQTERWYVAARCKK
jgi:SAM-dependent methyltransferase